MSLRTVRLGATDAEPISLEVTIQLPSALMLLWHVSRLPGAEVIAKKSWALTDDFEAYFLYKGRLFVLETPFAKVWVSLLGKPPDEQLFSEVERQVQRFSLWALLLTPVAFARYFFTPLNPPRDLLQRHGVLAGEPPSRVSRMSGRGDR